jgi:hypothetical protein
MTREKEIRSQREERKRIAQVAARLIAEDGFTDYTAAKRKALHHLGMPENTPMPDQDEIDAELQAHLRLFQGAELIERLGYLRRKAYELMLILQRFNPYLTGSVVEGTAGRYAEIDIQLFAGSAKEVEIYLINHNLDFEHSTPRTERAEAVLTLHDGETIVNLVVYPHREERISFKSRSGKPRRRMRLEALGRLLLEEAGE